MPAPRSTGGFAVHRADIDALAAHVDKITPVGPGVTDTVVGNGRYMDAPQPVPAASPPPPPVSPSAAVRLPFDVIAPADRGDNSTVYAQVNSFSLFVPDESSTDTKDVSGIGADFALSAGMYVYLQVDTDDGYTVSAVSVVYDTTGFGDLRIKTTGSTWDQSFYPLAQVYASGGTASHGGVIFSSGDGTAFLEVVNLCSSHLGLIPTVINGVYANRAHKTAATF